MRNIVFKKPQTFAQSRFKSMSFSQILNETKKYFEIKKYPQQAFINQMRLKKFYFSLKVLPKKIWTKVRSSSFV